MYKQLAFLVLISFAGCCMGMLYGLLFVHQKKGALFNESNTESFTYSLSQLGMTIARFLGFTLIMWYLLLLPKIQIILFMTTFLGVFWAIVIHKGRKT